LFSNLSPCPLPYSKGRGCTYERGLRPLSNLFPLSLVRREELRGEINKKPLILRSFKKNYEKGIDKQGGLCYRMVKNGKKWGVVVKIMKQLVNLLIDLDDKQRLENEAKRLGLKSSDFLRLLIKLHLNGLRLGQEQLISEGEGQK